MVLFFENIRKLEYHFRYLQQKTNNKNIFLVGGPLRDLLLGISSDLIDIDFTSAGNPTDLYNKIDKSDISIFKTDKFGTITIIPKKTKNTSTGSVGHNIKYELTPLRTEGGYEDFRHPGEITWSNSILDDSKRRDFTINCMYYHLAETAKELNSVVVLKDCDKFVKVLEDKGFILMTEHGVLILQSEEIIGRIFENGELNEGALDIFLSEIEAHTFDEKGNKGFEKLSIVIDPHKGVQDLIIKKIRAVGNPDSRFGEDALRVVRGIRFVNIFNQKLEKIQKKPTSKYNDSFKFFDIESNTWRSMKKNYFLVKHVAKERIKDEVLKAFKGDNPFGFVGLLDELNLLKLVFPALYGCKNVDQPVRYHPFDVYAHTMLTFFNIQQINKNYLVKLGMLYHDVGKPDQYYYAGLGLLPEERKQMHGSEINHPRYGVGLAEQDLKALGFSKKEIDEVVFYVKNHMVPGEILNANEDNIPGKVRKMLSDHGYKKVNNLFDISIADRLGQYNPLQSPNIHGIVNLKKLLKKINKEEGQFDMKQLAVNGNDVIQHFKIIPGPKVGELLKRSFGWVIDDIPNRNNKKAIFEYMKAFVG